MKAIVLIKMHTGDLRDIFRDLKRLRYVTEVHLTFGPYDVLAIIEAGELSDLGRIVANEIQILPGVITTCTCLMVDADALDGIQIAAHPADEFQSDAADRPYKRGVKSPFGLN